MEKEKRVIAIIPARGGSKRIPEKNIRSICGKPMLVWTIEAAQASGLFCEVFVSTDSEKVRSIAVSAGASVPFLRDKEDADDQTMVWVATTNALIKMEREQNITYDTVVQLMPNCPCRSGRDINHAYERFLYNRCEFQLSVFKFGWMNPWWAMKVNKANSQPSALFPDALKMRSQDLEDLFCPTGAIWIADAARLKETRTFYGPGYTVCPIMWQNAVDIDDEADFALAEMLLRKENGTPEGGEI